LTQAGSDGEPGGGGTGIGEMAGQLGTEPAGGTWADAFDLTETLDVGPQGWRGSDELIDLGFERGAFLAQEFE